MASEDDAVKKAMIVDARARNISHNVRCTECGSQSIEDSQADIAILLRKVLICSALLLSDMGIYLLIISVLLAETLLCQFIYFVFHSTTCLNFKWLVKLK